MDPKITQTCVKVPEDIQISLTYRQWRLLVATINKSQAELGNNKVIANNPEVIEWCDEHIDELEKIYRIISLKVT